MQSSIFCKLAKFNLLLGIYSILLKIEGIRRGAWVRRFETRLDAEADWHGRYLNGRRCEELSVALLQLKDTLVT